MQKNFLKYRIHVTRELHDFSTSQSVTLKDPLINKRLQTPTRESATSYGGPMPTEVGGVVERYEVTG